MASTYTTRIGLEKQGDGENANTWGLKLNSNVIDLVDEAIAGYETIDLSSGAVSLTDTDGVPNQARNFGLKFTGALTADTTVTIPAKEKIYYIFNDTTENYTIYIKPAGGTAVSVVEAGRSMIAATDGSNINLLESVDPNIYATKVDVQAVSATMATSIANVSATLESRIATVSSTMATSINNSNTAIASLSATVATSINNSNIAIAANTSSIAVVSSTMATSISNTNSRIAATSAALVSSINNRVAKAGDTMTGMLNIGATPVVSVTSTSMLNVFTSSVWGLDLQSTTTQVVQEFSTGVSASGPKYSGLIAQQLGTLTYSANAGSNPAVSATHQFFANGAGSVKIGSTGIDVSGTVSATNFDGGGSNITNLNAANIDTGVLPAARLSGDYAVNNTGTLGGFSASDFLRVTAESLGTNGYVTLSNGLIIQWGRKSLTSTGGETLTWNIPFPTACFMALGVNSTAANAASNITDGTLGTTAWTGIDTGSNGTYHWIAIGR